MLSYVHNLKIKKKKKNILYANLVSKSDSWAPQMKTCLLWYHSFQANSFLFGTSLVAQMIINLPAKQEILVWSWVRKIPGDGNGSLLQYSCLENSMDRGALVGYSPWGSSTAPLTCLSTYLALTASSTCSFSLSHLLNSVVPRTLSSALFWFLFCCQLVWYNPFMELQL